MTRFWRAIAAGTLVLIGGMALVRPAQAITYPVSAFPIQNFQSLFNTGASAQTPGNPGLSLYPNDGSTSPWTLQSFPAGTLHTGSTTYGERPTTFSTPFFQAAYQPIVNTGNNRVEWISPVQNPTITANYEPGGDYVFQTTFLAQTGVTPSTGYLQQASLAFNFAADNYVTGITLNGHSIYTNALTVNQLHTLTAVSTTNASFFNFGTTAGAATNTLRFTVHNTNGPVMLYTQFTSETYQPVPAPPAAISLGIGSLVGMIGTGAARMRRQRNRKKSA